MKVKFNSPKAIKTRLGIQKYGPAHKYFALCCKDRMNARYVPEKEGVLIQSSFVNNQCVIVYPQPYARYQYHGKLMVDPIIKKGAFYNENYGFWSRPKKYGIPKELTNQDLKYTKAGTGPYWEKRLKSAEIKDIEKEVQEYMKRGCK